MVRRAGITCAAQANFEDASWPQTASGDTAAGTCLDGFFPGAPLRICEFGGTWSDEVINRCKRTIERLAMHALAPMTKPAKHFVPSSLWFATLVCSAGVPGGGKPQRQRLWRDGRGCGSNWLVRSGLHTSGDRRAQTPVQERRQLGGRHHQRVPTYGADWPCSRSWFAIADAISERCPLCG